MINMMNLKTTSLALVCALAWLGGLDAAEAKSKTRPNIVFILADDLGWKDLGNEGSKYYESCLLYTSPSPRDQRGSRMPSSA